MESENISEDADSETDPVNNSSVKSNVDRRNIFSSLVIIILAFLVAILLTNFVFQSYMVQGRSMESTLSDKDRLIIWKLPSTISKITGTKYIPNRYDIIVFHQKDIKDSNNKDKQLIKRVIGLPGDRVVVSNGQITIYNLQNPQGYNPDNNQNFSHNIIQPTKGNIDLNIPDGQVFVSGDNRTDSYDSREFGAVPSENVVGKLKLRILPLSKFESF